MKSKIDNTGVNEMELRINAQMVNLVVEMQRMSREIEALKREVINARLGVAEDNFDYIKQKCEDDHREEEALYIEEQQEANAWHC